METKNFKNEEIDSYQELNIAFDDNKLIVANVTTGDTVRQLETLEKLAVSIKNGTVQNIERQLNILRNQIKSGVDILAMLDQVGYAEKLEEENESLTAEEMGEELFNEYEEYINEPNEDN